PTFRSPTQLATVILRHRIGETVDRHFLTLPTIKSQRVEPARIKRFQRQRKFFYILERQIVIVGNARGARFCVKTVSERFAQRVKAPARTRASLENGYIVTEF